MIMKLPFMLISFTALIISLLFPLTLCAMFTINNNCPFTIWPGTLSGSGTPQLSTTGFQLESGKSVKLQTVPGWSGRIWARTGCKFDSTGIGTCLTGDCGGKLECDGSGATPPASLFEITLGQGNNKDFYDVSIVDGYNLPLVAWPLGASGDCNATGCVSVKSLDQQDARKSCRWWEEMKEQVESSRVKVHVRHSDRTSTAAADSLQTQIHVDHLTIPMSSREPVQGHIATLMMMPPVHSLARLTIMP